MSICEHDKTYMKVNTTATLYVMSRLRLVSVHLLSRHVEATTQPISTGKARMYTMKSARS